MVAWLLDRPANTLAAFADQLGRDATEVREELQQRAYRHFNRWARERGFPRQQVFLSYQQAALDMLETSDGQFASQARIILEERFPHTATGVMKPPAPSRPNPSPKSGRWACGHDVHFQPFGLQNEQ